MLVPMAKSDVMQVLAHRFAVDTVAGISPALSSRIHHLRCDCYSRCRESYTSDADRVEVCFSEDIDTFWIDSLHVSVDTLTLCPTYQSANTFLKSCTGRSADADFAIKA